MLLLVGAGEIVFPHWIGHFLAAAREYQKYAGDKPLLQVFFGRYAGSAIAAVLIILLLFMAWLRRERAFTSVSFSSLVCAALALDLLIIPKQAPYNDVLLLPAALLLWARRDEMLHGRSVSRVLWRMALVCLGWEWGTAILLAMVSLVKRSNLPMAIAGIPLYTVYAIPTAVFLAIAVLAMRAGHTSEINTSATARS
jgi:hypothetical protein